MNNKTLIAVLLDRSGSMAPVKEATEVGFRHFLEEQKKQPGEAKLTLVQFDDQYEVNHWFAPLEDAHFRYEPRGNTALIDSLCRMIDEVGQGLKMMAEHLRPGRVVFVIITDGHENASRKFSRQAVADRIRHQQDKYKWEFVYLGANQDAFHEAQSYGIPGQNAMTYQSSYQGTQSVFNTASASTSNARRGLTANITDTMRKAYEEELKKNPNLIIKPSPNSTP